MIKSSRKLTSAMTFNEIDPKAMSVGLEDFMIKLKYPVSQNKNTIENINEENQSSNNEENKDSSRKDTEIKKIDVEGAMRNSST